MYITILIIITLKAIFCTHTYDMYMSYAMEHNNSHWYCYHGKSDDSEGSMYKPFSVYSMYINMYSEGYDDNSTNGKDFMYIYIYIYIYISCVCTFTNVHYE